VTERTANIYWVGPGKTGQGTISTESGALERCPYGFASRFGDDRRASNPEELLAAAHAACFTMAFSFAAEKAGLTITEAETTASVRLGRQGEGFVIDRIALTLVATGFDLDAATFEEVAAGAKRDCPLSIALAGVAEITLQATFREASTTRGTVGPLS